MSAMPVDASLACGPRPGRPRSAAADEAILAATVDLFADLGFDGVSIEAVAERAGVAKSTVYRRYPTKIDLVIASWHHCCPEDERPVDTGGGDGDLLAAAHRLRAVFTESRVGRAMPSALAAASRFPEFAEAHRAFVADRRAPVFAAVERGVARGELGPDTDPELLIDLVTGPIFYRAFKSGGGLTDPDLEAIVSHALASFR
jgi:AcrR family transcriptional regulator